MARTAALKKVTIEPPAQIVKVRAEGISLITPLKPLVDRLTITDPESYLAADGLLARIRNARALWVTKLEPIRGPLQRAIAAAKEAVKHAKDAAQGADQLHADVDGPLAQLEGDVKQAMIAYKVEERRQLQAAEEERQRAAQTIRDEAARKAIAAVAAKTPQMQARLREQQAALEVQAAEVLTQDMAEPVKGASSNDRTTAKVRIVDLLAFIHAAEDYHPQAGVYRMGHPPLRSHNKRGELMELIEVVQARLNELYREQPGVVKSWPGVEEYDDIIIARR